MARIEMNGKSFGRLIVVEFSHMKHRMAHWVCKCECGKETIVCGSALRQGETKSCGCLRHDASGIHLTTHGHCAGGGTPEYMIWRGMLARCQDAKNKNYGARGIGVCEEWLSFENFIRDMGARPSKKHSIERRDNDRGYSKDNCFWATAIQQGRNKRNNRVIETPMGSMLLCEAAEISGISIHTLIRRIDLKWDAKDLFNPPKSVPANNGRRNHEHR